MSFPYRLKQGLEKDGDLSPLLTWMREEKEKEAEARVEKLERLLRADGVSQATIDEMLHFHAESQCTGGVTSRPTRRPTRPTRRPATTARPLPSRFKISLRTMAELRRLAGVNRFPRREGREIKKGDLNSFFQFLEKQRIRPTRAAMSHFSARLA